MLEFECILICSKKLLLAYMFEVIKLVRIKNLQELRFKSYFRWTLSVSPKCRSIVKSSDPYPV